MAASEAWAIDEWRRARGEGDEARAHDLSELLWTANRSLVERAARALRGLPLDEARQISALALCRALDRFDPSVGVPFGVYVRWWFRKEGQAGQAAARFAVALPPHRLRSLTTGESAADVTLRSLAGTGPLDPQAPSLVDERSPEDAVVGALTAEAVREEVARLAPLTGRIVVLRFGFDGGGPRSNRAVAGLVGVSEFTVRAHVARALRTLRSRVASLGGP